MQAAVPALMNLTASVWSADCALTPTILSAEQLMELEELRIGLCVDQSLLLPSLDSTSLEELKFG